jgi:hypothetical protein
MMWYERADRDLAVRRNPVSDCADGVAIGGGVVPVRVGV